MKRLYNVLVIGSTGLVGSELINLLTKEFPLNELRLVSSDNSVDKKIVINKKEYIIQKLEKSIFENIDFCFFCSNSEVSKKWAKYASSKCKYVIDNSSYFRMDDNVSLIIPEVNFNEIKTNLISNPNCSTIQALLVINEIKKKYKIKRIIYSTYQACSGGGKKELFELIKSRNKGYHSIYHYPLSDTCISLINELEENQFSKEENKMINETKKILNDSSISIHASCIRVPVPYCHGVFIYLEVEEDVEIKKIENLLKSNERLIYKEGNEILYFQDAYQTNKVLVGRLKKDINYLNAFSLFCVGDNLLVGAAYNAYNIALNLIRSENERT